jgi:hypothetical protein
MEETSREVIGELGGGDEGRASIGCNLPGAGSAVKMWGEWVVGIKGRGEGAKGGNWGGGQGGG